MFMAFMSILILCSGPALGGKVGLLGGIRLKHTMLLVGALVVQVLITDVVAGAPRVLLVALHLATYGVAAVVLWANRKLPGLVLIGVGSLLNAVVIALNGGTLPASAHALAKAGLPVDTTTFANSNVLAHPILPWLGDIVASPSWLPFRNVVSIGDITILLGAFVLVHAVSRSKLAVLWSALLRRSRPAVRQPVS